MRQRHEQYNPNRPVLTEGDAPTDKEIQVWELLSTGASNKVICRSLGIGESTVKNHIGSLLVKMGVTNRVELALLWHGIDISKKEPRVITERDLRDMIARDCYRLYRETHGLREPWSSLSEVRKNLWRKHVTVGVAFVPGMVGDGT